MSEQTFYEKLEYYRKIFEEFYKKNQFRNILVRYSEIGTKSDKVQHRMENNLIRAIKIQLDKFGIKFTRYYHERGRFIFSFKGNDISLASVIILNVPGIASISPVIKTNLQVKNIVKRTAEYAEPLFGPNQEIGVKVKMIKRSMFPDDTPKTISEKCSNAILAKFPPEHRGSINIAKPDLKIFLEIRDEFTYIYSLKMQGFNSGLPIEKERASIAMCLNRFHDFDAMIRIINRGQHVIPVLFDTGDNYRKQQIENSKEELEFDNPERKFDLLWECFRDSYPTEEYYGIKINLEPFLKEFSRKLTNPKLNRDFTVKSVCAYCRYLRFHILSAIVEKQHFFMLDMLKNSGKNRVISSNIHFEDSRKQRRKEDSRRNEYYFGFRFLRGIVDGENENMYCPINENLWRMNPDFEEVLLQPSLIREDNDIKENLSNKLLTRFLILDLQEKRAITAKNQKNKQANVQNIDIEDFTYQKQAIIDLNKEIEEGLDNFICSYKTSIKDFNFKHLKTGLNELKLNRITEKALNEARLERLF